MAKPESDEVFSITSAPTTLAHDASSRQRRYLISMGIRTLCVVAAVILTGPLRWVAMTGAVFLPYVAVILANQTRDRRVDTPLADHVDGRRAIGPAPTAAGPSAPRSTGPDGS